MFTWNKSWIFPYESPLGIMNKFLYVNSIHGLKAAEVLTSGKKRDIDLYRENYIHNGIVSNYEIDDNKWLIVSESLEEYGANLLQRL